MTYIRCIRKVLDSPIRGSALALKPNAGNPLRTLVDNDELMTTVYGLNIGTIRAENWTHNMRQEANLGMGGIAERKKGLGPNSVVMATWTRPVSWIWMHSGMIEAKLLGVYSTHLHRQCLNVLCDLHPPTNKNTGLIIRVRSIFEGSKCSQITTILELWMISSTTANSLLKCLDIRCMDFLRNH